MSKPMRFEEWIEHTEQIVPADISAFDSTLIWSWAERYADYRLAARTPEPSVAQPPRQCTCPSQLYDLGSSEPNDSTCELTEEEHRAAAPSVASPEWQEDNRAPHFYQLTPPPDVIEVKMTYEQAKQIFTERTPASPHSEPEKSSASGQEGAK